MVVIVARRLRRRWWLPCYWPVGQIPTLTWSWDRWNSFRSPHCCINSGTTSRRAALSPLCICVDIDAVVERWKGCSTSASASTQMQSKAGQLRQCRHRCRTAQGRQHAPRGGGWRHGKSGPYRCQSRLSNCVSVNTSDAVVRQRRRRSSPPMQSTIEH